MKTAFERDKKVFFEWLAKGNKGKKEEIPATTLLQVGETSKDHCNSFQSYIWFKTVQEARAHLIS